VFTYGVSAPYGSSDNVIVPQSGVALPPPPTPPIAQNMQTGIIITDANEASSGTAPSDDAKKQFDEAKRQLDGAKNQMGVAQMEAAKAGAEVASSVAKQLATQKKEFNKQVSVVTSLKRNAKPSILTIKVTKENIIAQKNGRISTDEFMKRAEITQY